MIRQYGPQRFHYQPVGGYERPCGTIEVGTLFRAPPSSTPHARARKHKVLAWLPRRIGAGRRVGGRYVDAFVARGGHLALVQDLADGTTSLMADHHIARAIQDG